LVDGVNLLLPPSNFPVFDLRSKKRKINHARCCPSPYSAQPVIQPDINLLSEYIEFINVCSEIQEEVFQILCSKKVTHPRFFLSESINSNRMLEWGLKDGVIAQLRDNVFNFDQYLASKVSS
jgi:hypothetical protein